MAVGTRGPIRWPPADDEPRRTFEPGLLVTLLLLALGGALVLTSVVPWFLGPLLFRFHSTAGPWLGGAYAAWLVLATVLVARLGGPGSRMAAFACFLALALVGTVFLPGAMNLSDRRAQRRTMEAMVTVNAALSAAPPAAPPPGATWSVAEVEAATGRELPRHDAWGGELEIHGVDGGWLVLSRGAGGEPDGPPPEAPEQGPTTSWEADLALGSGGWVRWPEGTKQ